MKSIFIATALLGLVASAPAAFAQTAATGTGSSDAMAACPAAGSVPDAQLTPECRDQAKAAVTNSTTTATNGMATAGTTTASADSILASQFMGQTVYSNANETVGTISDLVMTKNLDNITAIIGVGGFLGMGKKDVAIPVNQLTAAKDANNNLRLTTAITKQQLQDAPTFDSSNMK